LISSLNSVRFGCVKIILVSSANSVGLDNLFIEPGKSLMYRRKSNAPIEPCGTPDL